MNRKKRFLESKEFKTALKQYNMKLDAEKLVSEDIIQFVEDSLEYSLYGEIKASVAYLIYVQWVGSKNKNKLSPNEFGIEIKKVLEHTRKSDGIFYKGVKVMWECQKNDCKI